MKGFLVINRINDVFFIDSDREFAEHINNQAKEQGLIQDDNDDDSDDSDKISTNIVMQLFSPLFMSQWFLIDHKKNPCLSITCENDFTFVFKQYEDLLLIAINGDGTESEEMLHRKVSVFVRLMEFLYGPVSEEIGYSKFTQREDRWEFLRGILGTWSELIENEQSFLVEAIERLHVNQAVNAKCIEILEAAVSKIQKAGEKFTHHALLVVNSKLLSLFSDRNALELQAADTMSIMLLVKKMFPSEEKLEDLFAFSYRKPDTTEVKTPASMRAYVPERYESALEGDDESLEDIDEQYQSATDTPPKRGSKTPSSLNENPYPQVSEHTPYEEYSTPRGQDFLYDPAFNQGEGTIPEFIGRRRSRTSDDVHAGPRSWVKNLFGTGRARSRSAVDSMRFSPGHSPAFDQSSSKSKSESLKSLSNDSPPPVLPVATVSHDDQYFHQTVFLCTEMCYFSPHHLHCLQIYPGMILVLVSEVPLASHANKLCQLLYLFKELLTGKKTRIHRAQGQELYDVINSLLSKIAPAIRKAQGKQASIFSDIKKRWENIEFKTSMLEYLEQSSNAEIPPGVERSLTNLLKKVKDLFLHMYLSPRQLSPRILEAVRELQDRTRIKLRDYKDYLSVKAQRNITMTTLSFEVEPPGMEHLFIPTVLNTINVCLDRLYSCHTFGQITEILQSKLKPLDEGLDHTQNLDMFPGLVHFLYVDRKTNHVMAPSLNISGGECDATQLLKEKIWKMTEWMQLKLKKGVTMVTARDGDFHFSYFLWFEDCNGVQMSVQQPFLATTPQSPPGILSGSFYRQLIRHAFPNVVPGSVNCYELMMMHVGLVHTQYIVAHCQKLTRLLWEMSGDPYTPMSLVW